MDAVIPASERQSGVKRSVDAQASRSTEAPKSCALGCPPRFTRRRPVNGSVRGPWTQNSLSQSYDPCEEHHVD